MTWLLFESVNAVPEKKGHPENEDPVTGRTGILGPDHRFV
jgi:hypothetical protein